MCIADQRAAVLRNFPHDLHPNPNSQREINMKSRKQMKPSKLGLSALASGLLALAPSAHAADVDVVATQLAFNATYGLNTLAADTTWTSDNVYILTDRVYVPDGVTLTIEAGTKIYSTFDDKGTGTTDDDTVGTLIIARGGAIDAQGNAGKPIIFDAIQTLEAERGMDLPYDSDIVVGVAGNAPGRYDVGLWGGVIILGNATISLIETGDVVNRNDIIEGFTPGGVIDADGDGFSDILEYGSDLAFPLDDADDSGTFRYVSIRHGGYNFAANNEINGLTLGGVGTGTTIDHVEVYANQDDGVNSSAARSIPATWWWPSVRTIASTLTKVTAAPTSSGSPFRMRAVTISVSGTVWIPTPRVISPTPAPRLSLPTPRSGM